MSVYQYLQLLPYQIGGKQRTYSGRDCDGIVLPDRNILQGIIEENLQTVVVDDCRVNGNPACSYALGKGPSGANDIGFFLWVKVLSSCRHGHYEGRKKTAKKRFVHIKEDCYIVKAKLRKKTAETEAPAVI